MKFVLFIITLLFCSGCRRHQVEYVQMAYQLSFDYSKMVRKEDNLILSGYGGGFLERVNFINLSFNSVREPDIAQARQLIVNKVEEFLVMVNSSCEIRPYLHNYPFEGKDVNFDIGFYQPNGEFVEPPNIAFVFVLSGNVCYSIYDVFNKKLEKVYSEPYEEALRIVQEQNAALCDQSCIETLPILW